MPETPINTPEEICQKCILPGTFPGITFDENGICKYCKKEEKLQVKNKTAQKKEKYRARFDELIAAERDKGAAYDVIMAYSGGKDSTYTLKILKEQYQLNILALTFDNHFVSPAAIENIKRVTDTLKVDTIIFKPPWPIAKEMFSLTAKEDIFSSTTLMRASAVCTACIGLVKSIVLKTALEMSIPLVGFGWSPGQAPIQSAIMKTNPALIRPNQKVLLEAYPEELAKSLKAYFIPDNYYEIYKDRFPYNIHPLAFFDYDEADIIKKLREMGWQSPEDTDTNSSNCLINAYANKCHIDRHGFHPYVWEIANMVRQGIMTREEGIHKIYSEQSVEMVNYAEERLK